MNKVLYLFLLKNIYYYYYYYVLFLIFWLSALDF